ncbi:MAG: LPS-assembly protein LptD [Treponema sp.]|nr:LPS-assembly protein LptD [Treponema sp.]
MAAEAADAETAVEDAPDSEAALLEMEIRTSTMMELAAWCRDIGIPEGGGKEELARRLRDYYHLTASGEETAADRKIITIESARSSEYFTLAVVDEEYARLRGDVVVSLKDGEAVHRIKAWEILYNRTRNLMTATGGVEYVKEEGDTVETFRGENITVNLDDWSSVFMEGISERSLQSDETTYRFAGTVISRNGEEVTVLTRAEITNAKNEEALWSLNASKLWLLPGSDFAIFNAVLKVGEIPVLYIPFFYFPADEVIFHPVLGYRSREGNFIQTTTYLLGRPKAASTSESSITKILGNSADMEKRREGIFLRSTGKKVKNADETSLKTILDIYANLGVYAGTELAVPKKGALSSLSLSGGMGFTRTITQDNGGNYSPFAPTFDGTSEWNNGRLFSWDVPFRYRLATEGTFSGRYGSFTFKLPYYSDPLVDRDFTNRTEEMDWVNMIQEGAALDEITPDNLLNTFEWQLTGSLTPSVTALSPYVSSLTFSSVTSTVGFRRRESKIVTNMESPNYLFFFPDKITLFSINAGVSGTPLTLQLGGISSSGVPVEEVQREDPLKGLPALRPPWGDSAGTGGAASAAGPSAGKGTALSPPALTQVFDLPQAGGPKFSIGYQLTPSMSSELQFRSDPKNWEEYDDIDWGEVSSVLTSIRSDGNVSFNLDSSDGRFYSNSFRLLGTGAWQDYTMINDEAEEFTDSQGKPDKAKIDAARERTYNASYFTGYYQITSLVRPLFRSAVWGNSSLQYNVKGLLAKTRFDGTGADPDWEMVYGKWDREDLDTHQFITSLEASVMDKAQNITLTADIPPEDSTLDSNATFRAWILESNAHMKIFFPGEMQSGKYDPLYLTETLHFGKAGSFQQYMVYDGELGEYTTMTSTLTLWGLSVGYTMTYHEGYHLESTGWVMNTGAKSLIPQRFTIGYKQTIAKKDLWKKRLSFSVNINSNLNFDLQRYTYSRFDFTLGLTVGIAQFVDLTLSTTSENPLVFWYVKDWPIFDLPSELSKGEKRDLFKDLIDSFRFDNDELRRNSGFKLKAFNLNINHHLGDWNAILGMTLSPYLDPTSREYKFNNTISFVVQWVPINEIKTDINYDKEKWTFK